MIKPEDWKPGDIVQIRAKGWWDGQRAIVLDQKGRNDRFFYVRVGEHTDGLPIRNAAWDLTTVGEKCLCGSCGRDFISAATDYLCPKCRLTNGS